MILAQAETREGGKNGRKMQNKFKMKPKIRLNISDLTAKQAHNLNFFCTLLSNHRFCIQKKYCLKVQHRL